MEAEDSRYVCVLKPNSLFLDWKLEELQDLVSRVGVVLVEVEIESVLLNVKLR